MIDIVVWAYMKLYIGSLCWSTRFEDISDKDTNGYKQKCSICFKYFWMDMLQKSFCLFAFVLRVMFLLKITQLKIASNPFAKGFRDCDPDDWWVLLSWMLYYLDNYHEQMLDIVILTPAIVSYRIVSYRIVSYRIVSYRIVSYRIVSYRIVSYRIVSYRIVSYRIVSYRIVSYRIVPYRTVPYRTVPYRTVPYRTVPYRTVPYRTVPYRTVPYRTVPYRIE